MAAYIPQGTEGKVPIDPDVKVPAAVRAAADRAHAIQEAFIRGDQPAPAEGAAPPEPPKTEATQPPPPTTPPTSEAPTASQEPPPPAAAAPTAPPAQPPTDDWEHRYRSLEGRLRRSENQRTSMEARINDLQRLLGATRDPPAAAAPPTPKKLITAEEEADYGTEFLTVVGKKSREELGAELANLQSEIATLKSQLGNVGQHLVQDARGKMYGDLDKLVPTWRAVNTNEKFLSWLALPDPLSGGIRHNLLKDAFARNNAARVAAFFKGFLAQEAASRPAATNGATGQPPPAAAAAPAPPARNGNGSPQVTLMDLAAPGRAKAAAPSGPAEKPSFTRAQINQFYADVNQGRYAGRIAEKDKLEAQIFEASREGRVT